MDSDQGKLFIGGISWKTDEDKLKEYFGSYGEVAQTVVMRDKMTAKPRGFGFVVFADPAILDKVLQDKHVIDGRTVEAKRAMSRDEQLSKAGNSGSAKDFGGGNTRTKKIFVGGLPQTLSEDGFKQYFEAYGTVTDSVMMYDKQTNRHRGFGFISFDSEDAVDLVLQKTFHDINGKQVEVKRALPKDGNSGGGRRSMGGNTKGYQSRRYSASNSTPYEARTEQSRYMQSSGGYPSYGSSGYTASGYGYGSANAGMGYGIGNYGPGGYGNPNALSSGYGGIHPSAGRLGSSPYGYGVGRASGMGQSVNGASGYGYGVGPVSGMGQSANGPSGYGNQGYGGYDEAYGGRGGYVPHRSASGDPQTGGYVGGGYYSGWQSDPSQLGYGGGYGSRST